MNIHINNINKKIESLRQEIINHKVYHTINDIEDLRIFMQYHIYAVWDFMSLLKSLQNNLTCTSVPWFPMGDTRTRQLINEIVLGEESDVDEKGNAISHFELYLNAMKQCGASTLQIEKFIEILKENNNFNEAFLKSETPIEAQKFVEFTFEVINTNKDYLQAAIFTFGREDLIPKMFTKIVDDINKKFPDSISIFKYYLDRHIEIDGDHHSHLALQMTSILCENDENKWNEVDHYIISSLEKRILLWDGAYNKIIKKNKSF
jgi:hypothetical protein